jgi:hypothetical protein
MDEWHRSPAEGETNTLERASLHDTIARIAADVVRHYGGQVRSDF